jgi:hypothetical protein
MRLVHLDNLAGEDPFQYFCTRVVEVPVPTERPPHDVNTSPTYRELEVLRLLQERNRDAGGVLTGFALERRFARAQRNNEPLIAAALATFTAAPNLSSLKLGWIDDVYRADGETVIDSLGSRILNPFDTATLFPPIPKDESVRIDYTHSSEPETRTLVDHLFSELSKP